jgi:hypothetical protein
MSLRMRSLIGNVAGAAGCLAGLVLVLAYPPRGRNQLGPETPSLVPQVTLAIILVSFGVWVWVRRTPDDSQHRGDDPDRQWQSHLEEPFSQPWWSYGYSWWWTDDLSLRFVRWWRGGDDAVDSEMPFMGLSPRRDPAARRRRRLRQQRHRRHHPHA